MCIEAGKEGWELIEIKELYTTAQEFLNEYRVERIVVKKNGKYIPQIRKAIKEHNPSHYVYDPRSYGGLWNAIRLSILLHYRGIVPICICTDLATRKWRTWVSIVTARKGVVAGYISLELFGPIFPHNRIVSPNLMPLSMETLQTLDKMDAKKENDVVFVGSMYEPRISILEKIKARLAKYNIDLKLITRKAGGKRIPDSDYWGAMKKSKIVIITTDQVEQKESDWTWINHVIYKYIEVLACGSLLIAPRTPGVERFLTSGEHYVPYFDLQNAAQLVRHYLKHDDERERIAKQGYEKVKSIVNSRLFWTCIDSALGKDCL